jgi:metal-responsive CopG/Arc/MetJ family transcriptional regulator
MLRKTQPSTMFHLRLKKELREKLDDFRFTHRFETRTEAIHWLLEYALSQNPKPKK